MRVNQQTLRVVAIAVLCVLAIGFASATLNSAVNEGAGSFNIGKEPNSDMPDPFTNSKGEQGAATGNDTEGNRTGGGVGGASLPCIEFFASIPYFLLLGGTSIGSYLVFKRGFTKTDAIGGSVLILFAGAVTSFLLSGSCGVSAQDKLESGVPNISSEVSSEGVQGIISAPMLTFGVAVLVFAPFFYFVIKRADQVEGGTGGRLHDDDETADETLEHIGRVAGDAADRLEADAAAVENEVYRAWQSMTEHLQMENARSSTPQEFADSAVAAGMDPDDVGELTGLFHEVRYGGADATEEREQRAIDALRHIEDEYAPDEDAEASDEATPDEEGEN